MGMREFRNAVDTSFNIEEFRTICFDLGIDYDSLRGEGKTAKVRELLLLCVQQGRLPELIDLLSKERPGIEWKTINKTKVNDGDYASVKKSTTPADELVRNVFENPDLMLGASIGAYNLIEFLGAGGSGLVFRATHTSLAREAALKILYPLDSEFSAIFKHLKISFRALGALDHPNIVKILDFNETSVSGCKTFFFVMEYVRGVDLMTWSSQLNDDANALVKRLHTAIQIAEALRAAHETTYVDDVGFEIRGVLHGDLKPANILVTNDDKAKLLDFMIVDIQRLMDPQVIPRYVFDLIASRSSPPPLTGAFGTPGFMAEEQKNQGIVTRKTDIYGLGITYFHLFSPGSPNGLADLPGNLLQLIEQQLSDYPDHRPTIEEVLQELQDAYSKLDPSLGA